MEVSLLAAVVILLLLAAVAIKKMRPRRTARRRGGSVGPGAAGAFYELLNEDRRNAIEIVVEDRAAYRDPEDAEGDLPKLEKP
jgi:hypothetical protein